MTARMLMIGLDAADGGLLDTFSADGTMPNLAALRASGRELRLSAPTGITDDGVWASFQYGVGLGGHGRYNYTTLLSTGRFGMSVQEEGDRIPFWRAPALEGRRVAILDIPKCARPAPFNGIQLLDWLVHGRSFDRPLSYPESLAGEVLERFGEAPPSRCGYHDPPASDAEITEVVTHLRTSVSMKRRAGIHYLKSEAWDLFALGFKEAHCAAHGLWQLVDPGHADYDPERNRRLGEPVRRIFADLDEAMGELITAAGRDAAIAVFSTSDFAPNGTAGHLMFDVIMRLNGVRPYRALRRLAGFPGRPYELLPYSDGAVAIRINAPKGSPRYLALRSRLELRLGELVDAETGEAVFTGFVHPADRESGDRAARLPDILGLYRTNLAPTAIASPKLGRFVGELKPIRPGNHVAGGRLFVRGIDAALEGVHSFSDLGALATRIVTANPGPPAAADHEPAMSR